MTMIRFERRGAIGSIVLASPPYKPHRPRVRRPRFVSPCTPASESDIRVLVVPRGRALIFSFGGEVREWPGKGHQLVSAPSSPRSTASYPRHRGAPAVPHRCGRARHRIRWRSRARTGPATFRSSRPRDAVFRCVEVHHGYACRSRGAPWQRLAERVGPFRAPRGSRWLGGAHPRQGGRRTRHRDACSWPRCQSSKPKPRAPCTAAGVRPERAPMRPHAPSLKGLVGAAASRPLDGGDARRHDGTLLFTQDVQRGFPSTRPKAFDADIEPPEDDVRRQVDINPREGGTCDPRKLRIGRSLCPL